MLIDPFLLKVKAENKPGTNPYPKIEFINIF